MYFYNLIKEIASKSDVELYIDMDGVIAAYDIGNNPYDFANKRPLTENIAKIEKVIEIENVTLHILSICREKHQIEDNNNWLDKNAPFFKQENRVIISRELHDWKSAKDLKMEFIKNLNKDKKVVLVDDDNQILKTIHENLKDVIVLQDSELVD